MPETTAHPSQKQLSAYNLGQLPPDEAVAIESHISECEPCCDTIISLSSDDTFVGLLKEARQLPTDQTVDQDVATTSSSCEDVPSQLAEHSRYEIVRLIGKGGMGDVYEARHRKMERTVALKVINRDLVRKPEAVDRFHREVKTAAHLSHPNIVTAFDADQAGDFHFMVMEYVDGVDLAATVKNGGALPIAKACDAIRQAAIGLQYAHEQGMVHRDVKPHNLMVTQGGTVKILDFGLASLAPEVQSDAETLRAQSDLTAAGSIMGTPDFISPEQAEDARQVDIRSDIYSLGTTLYYLLSGRPPFHDGSVMAKLKSHATEEPTRLECLRDDVPEELAALVARMTAKDPNERFQTPAEVAEALEPYVQDESQSQLQSVAETSHIKSRWGRPIRAIVTVLVVAIISGGGFWGVIQFLKEQDAKRAKLAYRQADAFLESGKNIGFIQDPLPLRNVIAPLIAELLSNKTDGAEYLRRLDYDHKSFVYEKGSGYCLFVVGNKVYLKSPRVGSAFDGMEFNTSHFKSIKKKDDKILMNLAVADTQQAKDACKKYGVEYSPSLEVKIGFDTLISGPSNLRTLLKDGKASVVAATTEKLSAIALVNGCEVSGRFTAEQAEVTVHNPTGEPRDVSFHCQIIYQNSRNRSDIFQLKAAEFKATVAPGRSTVKRFDRMVDPNASLPANYLKDLLVLRVSGERLDTTRDYPIAPDKKLDLAKQPVTITLWPSGVSPASLQEADEIGRKLIPEGFPPVGQPAGDATSDSGNAASEPTVQPAIVFGSAPFRFGGRVSSLEYSPDGKWLLSAGGMWGAALWDADTGELVRHFTGGNAWTVADISADGRYLGIAGYSQGTALIWDAHTGKQVSAIKKSKTAVRFAPDGKSVFTESGNKLKRFDIATGERLPGFTSDLSQYWSFATPQVGTLVAGHTPRGNLYVWDWKTGKEIAQTTKIHSGIHNAKDIVFTGDGQSLVVFGKHLSNTIELRATRTLEVTRTFKTRRGPRSLNISRDGKRLAVGCDLGWVQVFDLATGESIMGCEGHTATDSVSAVALSPDGKRLACGTDMSGAIRIWDVATAKELSPAATGHSATVGELAVLKDGTVLSQDYDRAFGRWDPETRKSTHFWNWPGPLEFPTEWALCSETGRALSGYNSLLLSTDPTDPEAFVDIYEKAKPPTERGRKGSEVFGSKTRINAVALSADGRRAAAAHINDRVVVCDLEGFKYVRTFTLPKVQHLAWDRQYSLALSPDGRLLAGSSQNKAALWEVETGTELDLPEIEFGLSRLAFSPNGKALALAGLYEVVICSVRDGKVLRRLVDRERGVRAIAFSPDSKLLATGGMEFTDTVTLWDVATGQHVSRLAGARGGAQSLAFSHDGGKLYAGTGSSLIVGWDLEKALTTGSDGQSVAAPKRPRFQLHFVEPRHIEGVTGPGIKFDTGAKDPLVYMHIKPALVLQPSHIASIKMRSYSFAGSPCYSIDIELTDAARKKLAAVVEGKGDHMRHVTYVVDGKRRGGWQRYEINVAKPGGIPEICRADTFCPLFTAGGKDEEEYVRQIVNALKPEESTSAPAPSEKATKTPTQEN